MSFGLDALFEERLEVFSAEPSSLFHSNGSAEAIIKTLIKERDDAQAKEKDHANTIDQLQRRLYSKIAPDANLPAATVNRLHRQETEVHNLRKENAEIKDNLRAAESENAKLCDTIAELKQKTKGANKKTKHAKEVAVKVEEKAKDAMGEKKRHLESERKMRKERNDALAALSRQEKITEDLRAELKVERSCTPHLRDNEDPRSDLIKLVIPMEIEIRRLDHMKTLNLLRLRQKYFINRALQWHEKWMAKERKEVDDGGEEEDGIEDRDDDDEGEGEDNGGYDAYYMEDEKDDKLYGGMIEGGDMTTGAEHDGWRSMRDLEAICRKAEARHNA